MMSKAVKHRRTGNRWWPAVFAGGALWSVSSAPLAENGLPEGSAAAKGADIYASQCASCHGPEGEGFIGPPVIGSGAALGVYGNGERLLEYISATMPQNNPGGLSDEQYRQVLAFILARNDFIEPDWSPAEQPPAEISLTSEP